MSKLNLSSRRANSNFSFCWRWVLLFTSALGLVLLIGWLIPNGETQTVETVTNINVSENNISTNNFEFEKLLVSDKQKSFLSSQQAFKFMAFVENVNNISLIWEIANGYYLYDKRITVTVRSEHGDSEIMLNKPPGVLLEDPYFGKQMVHFNQLQLTVALTPRQQDCKRNPCLVISYQGCAEAGLCYPVVTQHLTLTTKGDDLKIIKIEELSLATGSTTGSNREPITWDEPSLQ